MILWLCICLFAVTVLLVATRPRKSFDRQVEQNLQRIRTEKLEFERFLVQHEPDPPKTDKDHIWFVHYTPPVARRTCCSGTYLHMPECRRDGKIELVTKGYYFAYPMAKIVKSDSKVSEK